MRSRKLLALGLACWAFTVRAQDVTAEISQAALLELVQRIGPFSGAGVFTPTTPGGGSGVLFGRCEYAGYQECPTRPEREARPLLRCEPKPEFQKELSKTVLVPAADPAVTWAWWIDDPSITVGAGSMTFTAKVRMQVGAQASEVTRSVPATLVWDSTARQLRLSVGAFAVPVKLGSTTITTADVARHYGVTVPIQLDPFRLPLPDGSTREVQARLLSVQIAQQPGKVVLNMGLGF